MDSELQRIGGELKRMSDLDKVLRTKASWLNDRDQRASLPVGIKVSH